MESFPAMKGTAFTRSDDVFGQIWHDAYSRPCGTRGVNSRRRVLTVGHASKRCLPSSATRRTQSSGIGWSVVAWAEDWL